MSVIWNIINIWALAAIMLGVLVYLWLSRGRP